MTNKYVVTYTTENDREHVEPVYYKGSMEELHEEFLNIWKTVDMRWKMINFLSRLNDDRHVLMGSFWAHGQRHYEVEIGSQSWHAPDFGKKEVTNMPRIRTLDEWFYYESDLDLLDEDER